MQKSSTAPSLWWGSFIFMLVAGFYLYEFILQAAPGVMQQELLHDLNLDATQFGLISGSFFLTYTLGQIPAGIILDRGNIRWIMTIVPLLFALGAWLFAMARNLTVAIIARLLMGAVSAGAFISILQVINLWIPQHFFSAFVGIAETLGALGGVISSALFAQLLVGTTWRNLMVFFALIGLVIAGLAAFFIRQPAVASKAVDFSIYHALKWLFKRPFTWLIGAYSFCIWVPLMGIVFWGTSFLGCAYHLPKTTAANLIACAWLGLAGASPLLGWLARSLKSSQYLMQITAIIGCGALAALLWLPNLSFVILGILLFLIGAASAAQALSFVVIKQIQPQFNSTANGINNMFIVLSSLILQPVIGWLLDFTAIPQATLIYSAYNYQIALGILPFCYLSAFGISFYLKKHSF